MNRPHRPRLGLIGAGTHGSRYARHIVNDLPELELAGIFRRDRTEREGLARELGVTAFETVQATIEASDGVVIATPPPSHAPLARLALEAGKHVLLEKPATATLEEAQRLVELDDRAGGRVMVAHTLRYDSVIRRARQLLTQIAPVHYLRISQRLSPTTLVWQRDRALSGGGSILLTGVHLFDTAAWLLDEVVAIDACVAERIQNPATEDFFHATGRTARGVFTSLEVFKATTHRSCLLEIVGEKGQIFGDYQHHALTIGLTPAHRDRIEVEPVHTVREALADFGRFLRGACACPIPLRAGAAAMAAADRCYKLIELDPSTHR